MSYLPPVVARLSMNLGDFDAKIEEAKAKIKSLGDTVHIKMDMDNSQLRQMAQDMEAIHRMMGRDQALRERVNLDDADAKVRLKTLTRDRVVHVRVDVDKSGLSRIESFMDKIAGMLGGASGHSFNLPFVNFTANPIGLAAIAAGIAALLPELAGVISGFTAAGAGAGAFAALALPAFKAVSTALSQIKTDQLAYNRATTDKQRETALAHLKDDWKALDPAQRSAVQSIQQFSREYHQMAKAFEPQAFKVFAAGLKLMSDNLPALKPFADTFATGITKLLTQLDKVTKSKGFQQFLAQLHSIEGPALNAIGQGIGSVAASFGKLITVMSGKDVAHTLNIAFGAIAGTITGITVAVRYLMTLWDGMGLAIGNVKSALHGVAAAFDNVRHGVADYGHTIASAFDTARHAAATAAHNIASAFDNVRHNIAAKFDGVKNAIVSKFNGAGAWLASVAHNIATAFDTVRHDIAAKFDGIKNAVVSKFNGAIGWLISAGASIIQGLINGLNSKLGALTGVVNTIVGIVKSVAGLLGIHSPSTLFHFYGQMIGEGLALGMESRLSRVQSASAMLAAAASGGGWVGQAGPGMVSFRGGSAVASGSLAAAGGGGEFVNHVHVHLDGREIYSGIQRQAVTSQRRTGHNGMIKRTR